jgi:hypothetical protein
MVAINRPPLRGFKPSEGWPQGGAPAMEIWIKFLSKNSSEVVGKDKR